MKLKMRIGTGKNAHHDEVPARIERDADNGLIRAYYWGKDSGWVELDRITCRSLSWYKGTQNERGMWDRFINP